MKAFRCQVLLISEVNQIKEYLYFIRWLGDFWTQICIFL